MIDDIPPPIHGSLAVDVFGRSYHTNRVVHWNETNPGLGITAAFEHTDVCDYVLSAGMYCDSFNEHAEYAVMGLRFTGGGRKSLHTSAGLSVGILDGSGNTGLGLIPVVSIGYDRVDLCFTGMYAKNGDGERDTNGKVVPKNVSTSMIACFLSLTVLRF